MTGSEWAVLTGQNAFVYSTHRYQGTHMDPNREFEEGQVIIKMINYGSQMETSKLKISLINSNGGIYQARLCSYSAPQKPGLEYINRLVGALSGVAIFLMAIFQ
jgi:cytochrome c oxidase assembly protein subunit 15